MEDKKLPWFVKKDIDGFFGLGLDNLIQFILIVTLCKTVCGLPDGLIFGRILPGAAISILGGNIFYAWQARRLAIKTGHKDATALPYGINTVSLIAYIFFIMAPLYQETHNPDLVWKVGLLACLGSGIIEFFGAFVGGAIRRLTPRAALLSTLAGIAISFISMEFIFQIYEKPLIAIIPMAIIFVQYFSKFRFPFGLPGGLVAVVVGSMLAWALGAMKGGYDGTEGIGLHIPKFAGASILEILKSGFLLRYLSIIVPMGLFNVIGSLQNIESAEAGGDRYNTFSSLAANGIGSIAAAFFGSPFPTTIYIGHPGWKALGARWGYSIINGVFVTLLCLTGTITFVLRWVPLEAGVAILVWIGIIIVAQAFQETPKHHAPAVALGLFPALAAWGTYLVETSLRAAGTNLYQLTLTPFGGSLAISGMLSLQSGFIFSSMILSSVGVSLIERHFFRAALWLIAASLLSYVGIIHAYSIGPSGILTSLHFAASPVFAAVYFLCAVLFVTMSLWVRYEKLARKPVEVEELR